MPRCTIARLTVDRPSAPLRALVTAEWLNRQALNLCRSDLTDDGAYRARRFLSDGRGRTTTVNKLVVKAPGALSLHTRQRIAKWLRSRAQYLVKHNATAQTSRRGWFVQEFDL